MTSPPAVQYAERHVRAADLRLRYVEAGEGELLVWLHGGAGLHQSAGTDLLTKMFRVVAIELPGFGASGGADTARTFDELSEQVAVAVEALGLTAYVLHGTSFGAATALHLALNHPERVTRLILESPAAFRPVGWTPPDLDAVRRGLFRHPERARRVQIDPDVAARDRAFVNRISLTVDRQALAARLGGLTMPTLVMFGESDTLTPPDLAGMYCDNAPNCSVVLIPDAAHVISSDRPELYATTVRDFALVGPASA
jgi:pimeloyl-ACP methyl ester carboxylesterase